MEEKKGIENEWRSVISELNLKKIIQIIRSVQYGSVTLIIQEGKVVQIEKNEKLRLK